MTLQIALIELFFFRQRDLTSLISDLNLSEEDQIDVSELPPSLKQMKLTEKLKWF